MTTRARGNPQRCVVYLHTNVLTGKSYVGLTSKTWEDRWQEHIKQAKYHETLHLYRALRKHGSECWLHSVLETCPSRKEGELAECRWIAELGTRVDGYNIAAGGALSRLGCVTSESTKEKMREAQKDRPPPTDETRKRMSEAGKRRAPPTKEAIEKRRVSMLGRKHTEEEKRHLSEKARQRVWTPEMMAQSAENLKNAHAKGAWNKGIPATSEERERFKEMRKLRKPLSPESKESQRQKLLGRKMSPEAIEKSASKRRGRKLSEAHKAKLRGRTISEENKQKVIAAHLGHKASEETRRKMSVSNKRAAAERRRLGKVSIRPKQSEEAKRNISAALKRHYAAQRANRRLTP